MSNNTDERRKLYDRLDQLKSGQDERPEPLSQDEIDQSKLIKTRLDFFPIILVFFVTLPLFVGLIGALDHWGKQPGVDLARDLTDQAQAIASGVLLFIFYLAGFVGVFRLQTSPCEDVSSELRDDFAKWLSVASHETTAPHVAEFLRRVFLAGRRPVRAEQIWVLEAQEAYEAKIQEDLKEAAVQRVEAMVQEIAGGEK